MSTNVIAEIKKNPRRRFSAEEKIRIVMEGIRGETPTTQLCRRENISPAIYYRWSKEFLEAGKNGLTRETKRSATDEEVKRLRHDNEQLKVALAEMHLEVIRYKKSLGVL